MPSFSSFGNTITTLPSNRSAVIVYELYGYQDQVSTLRYAQFIAAVPGVGTELIWTNTGTAPNVQLQFAHGGQVVIAWAMGAAISGGSVYTTGQTIILNPFIQQSPFNLPLPYSRIWTFP